MMLLVAVKDSAVAQVGREVLSGKLNERARVDLEAVEMRFSDGVWARVACAAA